MKVAAIYDIHGNLPALEAVLQDIREEEVDQVVVGGDIVPGPMPRETLSCLLNLDLPVSFIHGNAELAMLAQMAAADESEVTYWGTTSGGPLPEQYRPVYRWTVQQLYPEFELVLASWPKTLRLEIPELGDILFCHATPRSETEVFTRLTPEEKLLPMFDELNASIVVCGHTHMQFDRMIGRTRVVNTGSVGEPYGNPGAYWLLLGPDVQLKHTNYDLTKATERIRETEFPGVEDFVRDITQPPSEAEMIEVFTKAELT
ncbi:MAG TPA: metallophosphoesterase family protein [Anaerolineales bacterium]|nr:metallophosphoesterase family protein [Anaerolineales bacterium]